MSCLLIKKLEILEWYWKQNIDENCLKGYAQSNRISRKCNIDPGVNLFKLQTSLEWPSLFGQSVGGTKTSQCHH